MLNKEENRVIDSETLPLVTKQKEGEFEVKLICVKCAGSLEMIRNT